jgi:hypothetical protein
MADNEQGGAAYQIQGSVSPPAQEYQTPRGAGQVLDSPVGAYEEDEEFNAGNCPTCGGPGQELGALGRKHWMRCRNCGCDFSAG